MLAPAPGIECKWSGNRVGIQCKSSEKTVQMYSLSIKTISFPFFLDALRSFARKMVVMCKYFWKGRCWSGSNCKFMHPIQRSGNGEPQELTLPAPSQKNEKREEQKFAYVCVLWSPEDGNAKCIYDALVLGHSLRRTKTNHSRVLLATPDLLENATEQLETVWNDIRPVEHVVAGFPMNCAQRFHHVLTKLSVMKLTEYSKVFLLDADTLVRRNIDEIFDQPAPRGFMRGDADHRPNEVREAHT